MAFAWTFTPLDVGIQTGIFAKHGLDVEASAAAGDAKLQQALTADSADIGIGSGPGMAFMAKGVPAKAVAVMYGVPRTWRYGRLRLADQDGRRPQGQEARLHHRRSLTHWIGDRINQVKGWGSSGITMVPIGGMPPARAAMKTNRSTAISARSKPATRWKSRRNGASSPAPRRSSTFHHPRLFRARRAD